MNAVWPSEKLVEFASSWSVHFKDTQIAFVFQGVKNLLGNSQYCCLMLMFALLKVEVFFYILIIWSIKHKPGKLMIRRVLKLGDNSQDIHFYYRSLLVICLHSLLWQKFTLCSGLTRTCMAKWNWLLLLFRSDPTGTTRWWRITMDECFNPLPLLC